MKFLIVLVSAFAASSAAPSLLALQPTIYSSYGSLPVIAAGPAVTQYHAQDELGQYSYGYAGGPSAKNEVKTIDGVTRGSYSYVDSNAKLQTVEYVADALGFRVAATNLPTPPVDTNVAPVDTGKAPEPVEDTVEVKKAREEHLAAVAKAAAESDEVPEAPEAPELVAPEPVEDTVEVKQAREEHLQAVEEAKARQSQPIVVEQPQLIQSPAATLIQAPITTFVQGPAVRYLSAPAAVQVAQVYAARPASSFAYSVAAPGYPQLIAY